MPGWALLPASPITQAKGRCWTSVLGDGDLVEGAGVPGSRMAGGAAQLQAHVGALGPLIKADCGDQPRAITNPRKHETRTHLGEGEKLQVPLGPLGIRHSSLGALWHGPALRLTPTVPLESFTGASLGLEWSPANLMMKLSLYHRETKVQRDLGALAKAKPCPSRFFSPAWSLQQHPTQERVRNVNSQFPPQTTCSRNFGAGAQQSVFA